MFSFRDTRSALSPSTSACGTRPISSLSSSSAGGESGLTGSFSSGFGGLLSNALIVHSNSGSLSSNSSGSISLGSSPIPSEEDVNEILQHTATLLALKNQAESICSPVLGLDVFARNGSTAFGIPQLQDTPITLQHSTVTLNTVNNFAVNVQLKNRQTKNNHSLPPVASGRKSPKPDSYKTVMCQAWLETGKCNFAENCRFAHGEQELRPSKIPIKNPKYKTKLCDKYTMTGLCPYGNRCLFIHPDATGSNAYIHPDRLAKIERERAALNSISGGSASEAPRVSLSSRSTSRPPSSWPLEPPKFFSAHRDFDGAQTTSIAEPFSCDARNAGSADVPERNFALGDITNRGSMAFSSDTMSSELLQSGKDLSPDSANEHDTHVGEEDWSLMSSDPFHLAIYNDNKARQLASAFSL